MTIETDPIFDETYYKSLEEDGLAQHRRDIQLKVAAEEAFTGEMKSLLASEARMISRLPLHERIAQGYTDLPSSITAKFKEWKITL